MTFTNAGSTNFFIGRDDGVDFGPFTSAEKALEWATRELSGEEVLPQYREEAIQIRTEFAEVGTEGYSIDKLHGRMMDLVESVDWTLFSITTWGLVNYEGILDDVQSPQTVLQPTG
jgi:hypothetical protein